MNESLKSINKDKNKKKKILNNTLALNAKYFIDTYKSNKKYYGNSVETEFNTALGIENDEIDAKEKKIASALFGNISESVVYHSISEEEKDEPDCVKRNPAWIDEDDEQIKIKSLNLKKNQFGGAAVALDSKYSSLLEKKFISVFGATPKWADLDKKEDDDSEDDLEKSTGNYLSSHTSATLQKGAIEHMQMKDINSDSLCKRAFLNVVKFNKAYPLAMIAGLKKHNMSGIVSIYQVDGKFNHNLGSFQHPQFHLNCGTFSNDGNKFLIGAFSSNCFYFYDLESSKKRRIIYGKRSERNGLKKCAYSPCGHMFVLVDVNGIVLVYDSLSVTLIDKLIAGTPIKSVAFTSDSSTLYAFGETGEITLWDMKNRICTHKFYDEGCIKAETIAVSPNGQYVACGSSVGIVNVYETHATNATYPKPVKTLQNLVTSVTGLMFNPTSDILAMSSGLKPDAIKLVHVGSMSVFRNFPSSRALGRPISFDFSPSGGYLGIGNNIGCASLHRLKYFPEY